MAPGAATDDARAAGPARRDLLRWALCGAACPLTLPATGMAQARRETHEAALDLPALAEDATAVPVRVWVEHPMEPDHFIRSIALVLDTDPVPHKGSYRFTPGSGQAWIAFPMRSGIGGRLTATVECSRHGRFTTTRELRVASDGCAALPYAPDRRQAGNPRLRLPSPGRLGEVIDVLARLDHDSDTGLGLRQGNYVRERPEFFVRQVRVYLDRDLVSDFRFTSALSANPIIRFRIRVSRAEALRVVFVNSEGRRWETTERIRPLQ